MAYASSLYAYGRIGQSHMRPLKCYCYDYHFLGDVATCTRESEPFCGNKSYQ
jgi:hypothetical protein